MQAKEAELNHAGRLLISTSAGSTAGCGSEWATAQRTSPEQAAVRHLAPAEEIKTIVISDEVFSQDEYTGPEVEILYGLDADVVTDTSLISFGTRNSGKVWKQFVMFRTAADAEAALSCISGQGKKAEWAKKGNIHRRRAVSKEPQEPTRKLWIGGITDDYADGNMIRAMMYEAESVNVTQKLGGLHFAHVSFAAPGIAQARYICRSQRHISTSSRHLIPTMSSNAPKDVWQICPNMLFYTPLTQAARARVEREETWYQSGMRIENSCST